MVQDQTDDADRPSDSTYQQLIEHATEALFVVGSSGRFETVNGSFLSLTGYDRRELYGSPAEMVLPDGERDEWHRRVELLRNDVPTDSEAWISYLETRQGVTLPAKFEFTAVDPDGTVVGSVRDTRKQRDQQIRVLNRALRHDIRNQINLILMHATSIQEVDDPQYRTAAQQIEEVAERIVNLSDKARKAQKHLDSSPNVDCSTDLVQATETVVTKSEIKSPAVAIRTDLPDRAQDGAPPAFDVALTELIENAIVHHPSGAGPVSVEIYEVDETYHVRVLDECDPISQATISSLKARTEDPLKHAEGIGLWLAQWIVDAVGGALQFDRRTDREGNVVTLIFDTVRALDTDASSSTGANSNY